MITALLNVTDMNNQVTNRTNRRFCCYKGCSSDRLKTRDGAISFFGFPIKDTERCSIWITNIGREEFRYLNPKELSDKRICELHFERSMFSNDFKTNLTKRAVPKNCNMSAPELIQIEDDDDENSDECESGIVSETSLGENVNGDVVENGTNKSCPINGQTSPRTTTVQKEVESAVQSIKSLQEQPLSQSKPPSKQSTTMSIDENKKSKNDVNSQKSGPTNKNNTKFHNLPPQTTHSDFYYQQCLSAEETNNSFPEPPEGELPLFVQQNSVVSLEEEPANVSDISEPLAKKRRRDKDSDDLADQMRDAMKHLRNITALLTNSEDEFELFGKSVALQLKKMSLCSALDVQAKIQTLLSTQRINDIKDSKEKSDPNNEHSEESQVDEKATEEEEEEENDQAASPQLSLTCASETSDNDKPT